MPSPQPPGPALTSDGSYVRSRGGINPGSLGFTAVLGLLAALPALSIDISQPTLLVVQSELGTSLRIVGLTLTLFMVGFALGQFGAGPLSDRVGRRLPLVFALLGYMASGLGCAFAGTATALVAWRFVQGVSAGACVVLAFATVRDLFEGEEARAKRSYVTTFVSLAPVLAPTLGAAILGQWGWRPIYGILAAAAAVLLVVTVVGLGETRPLHCRRPMPLSVAYGAVLSDTRFLGPVIVNALSYGGIFAYIAGSAAVLIGELSLTPRGYGAFFACTALSLTAGALTSARSGRRGISSTHLLWIGLVGGVVATILLSLAVLLEVVTIPVALALLVTCSFCRGLAGPNAQHLALEPMFEHAGTASAAMGVLQILTGAAASVAVTMLLPVLGAGAMAHVMAVLSLSALFVWITIVRRPASP